MIHSAFRPLPQGAQLAESPRWYACYPRGRHEKKVASHLNARRTETFLPVHGLDVRWSGRRGTPVDLDDATLEARG